MYGGRFEQYRAAEDVQCYVSNAIQKNVLFEYMPEHELVRFRALGDTHGAPIPIEMLDTHPAEEIALLVQGVIQR